MQCSGRQRTGTNQLSGQFPDTVTNTDKDTVKDTDTDTDTDPVGSHLLSKTFKIFY